MYLQSLIRTKLRTASLDQVQNEYDSIGQWFLLCQIGRNSTPYYFREFLRALAGEMDKAPKSKFQNNERPYQKPQDDLTGVECGGAEQILMKQISTEKAVANVINVINEENC